MRFLLLPLLLLPLTAPALAQMKFVLQYQDQFGKWHRYQEKHNEGDAYRTAKSRAAATGKRFRIVDGDCRLIDLVEPSVWFWRSVTALGDPTCQRRRRKSVVGCVVGKPLGTHLLAKNNCHAQVLGMKANTSTF